MVYVGLKQIKQKQKKSTNKENHCKLVDSADSEFLSALNAEKCYVIHKNSNY